VDLKLLETLKEKLANAKDFKVSLQYFFDHFGMDPGFIALGRRVENPLLDALILQVGEMLFKRKVKAHDWLLTEIPEYQFLHGGGLIHDRMATLIFFADLNLGLLAIMTGPSLGNVLLTRFSLAKIEEGRTLVLPPPSNKSVH